VIVPAATFTNLVLAVHILGVVVGFGVTFAYPIFFRVGSRLEPGAMPWFFRMMQLLTRQLVYPGLLIVLVCGIYLASKEDQFSAFYVQWGFFAVVAIGAVEGGVMAPRVRKLIDVSQRDLAAAPVAGASPSSAFSFSADYRAVFNQLSIGGAVQSLIVVVTVFFMATHAGA
jgi:hypothetical protein